MTKNDKFRELAGKRMKTLSGAIAGLARCANRSKYEFSRYEVSQILARLRAEYETLELAFREPQQAFEFYDGPQAVQVGAGQSQDGEFAGASSAVSHGW